MSSSHVTIALQNKEYKEGTNAIKGIDLINALTKCIKEELPIGHYIANLVIYEKVPLSKRHKARVTNLVKDGQLFWARKSRWNEVRAWIRMLDKLES